MKKILFVLLFTLSCQLTFAQLFSKERILNNENFDKQFLSWGYYLGFNSYDFNFNIDGDS